MPRSQKMQKKEMIGACIGTCSAMSGEGSYHHLPAVFSELPPWAARWVPCSPRCFPLRLSVWEKKSLAGYRSRIAQAKSSVASRYFFSFFFFFSLPRLILPENDRRRLKSTITA
ncbi:hypothetical protein BHE74_00018095 [Ensete ventricosum]|nr:hypothetical protein BHE74_00018095 [Ensete ventricosum]